MILEFGTKHGVSIDAREKDRQRELPIRWKSLWTAFGHFEKEKLKNTEMITVRNGINLKNTAEE